MQASFINLYLLVLEVINKNIGNYQTDDPQTAYISRLERIFLKIPSQLEFL